jgi:hypothetical protein
MNFLIEIDDSDYYSNNDDWDSDADLTSQDTDDIHYFSSIYARNLGYQYPNFLINKFEVYPIIASKLFFIDLYKIFDNEIFNKRDYFKYKNFELFLNFIEFYDCYNGDYILK